jgi:regulatory protein
VIRKGRAAPSGQREARRFGVRSGRRDDAVRDEVLGAAVHGGPDPLDPSSDYPAPDPSARASDQAGRSGGPTRSLKMRAIDYLSRREYSRAEITRKLAPFVEEGEELDPLLDSLEREGWLSDARFAESVMNRRSARMGTSRIVSELRQHGVDASLIDSVGSQLRETERVRARAVWQKKFGELPRSPAERAKQARFLAMRGFSSATISQILKGDDDWSDE